jgi:halocyanin-like protein
MGPAKPTRMTDGTVDVSRRGFLTATAGGAAAAAMAGPASAQGEPDFGGYLDDVPNYDGVVDKTGQDEVTVTVGGEANNFLSFEPPAIHVDPGTTVVWEWTGKGGSHNVVHEGGNFESDLKVEQGFSFSHTFETDGIFKYYCQPHKVLGMKGAVVVGSDYPTTDGGDGSGGGGGDGGDGGGNGGGDGGGGGTPEFGGWFDDVPNYDGVVDKTGSDTVSVSVGGKPNDNLSFVPAAVHVDNGATVEWEWTGDGGSHNVVHQDGNFESELKSEAGTTFSHTFEEDGIYNYYCDPHRALGMKGSVVVGSDYAGAGGGGGGGGGGGSQGPQPIPQSAMTLSVATSAVMVLTLGLGYLFVKFGGAEASED